MHALALLDVQRLRQEATGGTHGELNWEPRKKIRGRGKGRG